MKTKNEIIRILKEEYNVDVSEMTIEQLREFLILALKRSHRLRTFIYMLIQILAEELEVEMIEDEISKNLTSKVEEKMKNSHKNSSSKPL